MLMRIVAAGTLLVLHCHNLSAKSSVNNAVIQQRREISICSRSLLYSFTYTEAAIICSQCPCFVGVASEWNRDIYALIIAGNIRQSPSDLYPKDPIPR